MDASILAKFPEDDHVLGPFLGNLPPEILDVVVRKLGWFETTFAMAGRTCREAVERVPSARAVLTEEEREQLEWSETSPLAVAVMEGDVEALEWLMPLFEARGVANWRHGVATWGWRDDRLTCLAAGRGMIESLTCLRANECPWNKDTCEFAARGGHLEVLQWARQNGCEWDKWTCAAAAKGGHLEVLQWLRQNGCEWDKWTCHERVRRTARAGGGRAGGAAVVASERVPVGRVDVLGGGFGRAPGGVAVGASERVPVGRVHAGGRGEWAVRTGARGTRTVRGGGRAPRGVAVGAQIVG